MTKFKFKAGNGGYTSWYLLPTIRVGTWERKEERGGWVAFTFLKFDACLMWATQK